MDVAVPHMARRWVRVYVTYTVDEIQHLGHSATLTTTIEQSSDSTKVVFVMDGVPVGMKDEIKGNIERY